MKTKFFVEILLVWILVPPIVLSIFQRGVLDQLYVGIVSGVIALAAIFLANNKRLAAVAIVVLTLCTFWQVWSNFPSNQRVFFQTTQPEVRYSDQLIVVEEINRRAGDRPFEIQAFTIPYFWQDAWTYLFWWKGKTPVSQKGEVLYVIVQRDDSTFQENWYRDIVSTWGTLVDTFSIGAFTVEERLLQ